MIGRWVMRILILAIGLLALQFSAGEALAYFITTCAPGSTNAASLKTDALQVECGGRYNLCGYRDREGKLVIAQRFEVAFRFTEGLAGVRIDGEFGFIDESGKLVIPATFDLVGTFTKGLAEVIVDGKAGVIDRRGQTVVVPAWARAVPFGGQSVLLREGTWRWERSRGCENLDSRSTLGLEPPGRKPPVYWRFDISIGSLSPRAYTLRHFDDLSRGLVWASTGGDGFGLLRSDGGWQIAPSFRKVESLFRGYATVCGLATGRSDEPAKDTCGAVDKDGHLVVPVSFDGVFQWRTGLKLVRRSEQVGIVDTSGELLGGRMFDDARLPREGDISLVKMGVEWLGLDRDGRIVANPDDGEIVSECPSGLRAEKRSGRIRLVGANGRATEPFLFGGLSLEMNCDGLTAVELNGKWGFVGTDGRLSAGLPAFDNVFSVDSNHRAVKLNGKWGIMDTSGRYIVEPRYDELFPDEGVLAVSIGGGRSWIDGTGNEVVEPPRTKERAKVLSCGEGAGHFVSAEVHGQTLWGFAGPDGAVYVEPKYRALRCYANGLAWVADDQRRMWCQIDSHGTVRDPAACDRSFNGRIIFDAAFERFDEDPYESSVLWERALLDYGRGVRKHSPGVGPPRF